MALDLLDQLIETLDADLLSNGQRVVVTGLDPEFNGKEGYILWQSKDMGGRYFIALEMEDEYEDQDPGLCHLFRRYLRPIRQNMLCLQSMKIADIESHTICTWRQRASCTFLMVIPHEVILKQTIIANRNIRRTKSLWRNTARDLDQLCQIVALHQKAYGYFGTD